MHKATAIAFAIMLGCSVTWLDSAHAQINLRGQKYETAPIGGDAFVCYVTNVSQVVNAVVANVRIYNGSTGSLMQVNDDLNVSATDCQQNGSVLLLPNQTCGIGGIAAQSGSPVVDRTVGHCVFTALGIVRGSLETRTENDGIRLRTDAKPTNDH